jgi:hypothetical protein
VKFRGPAFRAREAERYASLRQGEKMKVYCGFAIADSMFPAECRIVKHQLTVEIVHIAVSNGAIPCLNPSHAATIAAMKERFGITVAIPEKAPLVNLQPGDSVIVMSVRGLPRLEGRHEYTPEEIEKASVAFAEYTVEA